MAEDKLSTVESSSYIDKIRRDILLILDILAARIMSSITDNNVHLAPASADYC